MNTQRAEKVAEELGLRKVMTNRSLRLVSLFVIFAGCGTSAFAVCEKETTSFIEVTRTASDGVLQRTGWQRFTFENHKLYLSEWLKVGGPYKSTTWMVSDINAVIAGETQVIESLKKDMNLDGVSIKSAWTAYRLCFMRAEARGVFPEVANAHLAARDLNSLNAGNSPSQPASQQNQSTQQQSQQAQQQAQQARAAQQQSQQAVFNSAQNQTAADQTRKSERRRHEPENEAHECLSLDKSGLFGGIVNKCDFKVAYQFCNFNPKKDSWAESHTCGKSGGADFVGAGRTSAAHVKNTETVYWFACKDPAWPVDVEYVAGKGIQARCYTIGGK